MRRNPFFAIKYFFIFEKKIQMLMKVKIILTLLTCLFIIQVKAQWVPCNNGMDGYVWGSAVYNGELYACGNFEHADGNQALAISRWNGTAWNDVGGGFQHNAFSNVVRGLIEFNGELIAGGYVDSVAGMPIKKVAKWNGSSWSAMGNDCPINTINCFAIHNGELYAGGEGSGLTKVCVAKWTGTNWVGLDIEANNTDIWTLCSYNGKLYAGGGFSSFNGVSAAGIVAWDGSTWSDIGTGLTAFNTIRALTVFNNKLYIGGAFTTIGSVSANNVASWDGTSFAPLSGGVNAGVQSLLPYGDKLFVGGTYWMVDNVSANRAAYWDGLAWTVLGSDLGAGARTQQIYNNELYSLGEGAFNGQNYAARWTGGTFTGIEELTKNNQVYIYPNPTSGKLNINNKNILGEYYISDLIGKTIYTPEEIHPAGSSEVSIDVSSLPSGMYFLSTKNSNIKPIKFIVSK